MRKTGSRDPRESLEASAVSPCSMAVNTFSMRFGSRRNQRPHHQKHRSMTTGSPMIDTMRIGHIIGPPLWNLSINQLPARKPVGCASAAGEAAGDGLVVVAAVGLVTAPGAGLRVTGIDAPGTAGCCPGGTFVAGDCMGAAGFAAPGVCRRQNSVISRAWNVLVKRLPRDSADMANYRLLLRVHLRHELDPHRMAFQLKLHRLVKV